MLLTGACLGVGALMIFLRWPAAGLITLLLSALMLPSPYLPGGLNLPVLLLLVLVLLWIADMVILRQELQILHSRPLRPLLVFMGITLLSFVMGQLPWFSNATHAPLSAQFGGLLIFLLSAGAFLLAAHQLHDLRWLRWLTWLFVLVGWLHVAGWFIPGVGGITSRLIRHGVIDNGIYWTWLVALAFSQAWLNRDLPIFWRVVFGFIALIDIGRCLLFEPGVEVRVSAGHGGRRRHHRRPILAHGVVHRIPFDLPGNLSRRRCDCDR